MMMIMWVCLMRSDQFLQLAVCIVNVSEIRKDLILHNVCQFNQCNVIKAMEARRVLHLSGAFVNKGWKRSLTAWRTNQAPVLVQKHQWVRTRVSISDADILQVGSEGQAHWRRAKRWETCCSALTGHRFHSLEKRLKNKAFIWLLPVWSFCVCMASQKTWRLYRKM